MILLFVPGHKKKFIEKAKQVKKKNKDVKLIYDLEDSVPDDKKKLALKNVAKAATSNDWVRLHDKTNETFNTVRHADGFVVPKAEEFDRDCRFIPIIETAFGLEHADKVVRSAGACIFGQYDLAVSMRSDAFTPYAMERIVTACRAYNVPVYNSPHYSTDLNIIAQHAKLSYDMGFDGVCVLHPDHIQVVRNFFLPDPDVKNWAKEILNTKTGELTVKRNMIIGPPILERARQILS